MGHFATDTLPFVRGHTLSDGVKLASPAQGGALISQIPATGYLYGLPLPANFYGKGVVGRVYNSVDIVTGEPILLRAVQAAAAITVVKGMLLTFDLTATAAIHGRYGKVVQALASGTTAGVMAKPIDPAYAAGLVIAAGDVFYVVEKGIAPVKVTNGVTVVPGDALSYDTYSNGYGALLAAAGYKVIGTALSPSYTAAADPYTGLLTVGGTAATPGANGAATMLVLMEVADGIVGTAAQGLGPVG
jgi:hypothetical protein